MFNFWPFNIEQRRLHAALEKAHRLDGDRPPISSQMPTREQLIRAGAHFVGNDVRYTPEQWFKATGSSSVKAAGQQAGKDGV